MDFKKKLGWYKCKLNEGKKKFKEIGRWFSKKWFQYVNENDNIVGIGYFMSKNYKEKSKIKNVIEHLDGVFDQIQLVVLQEIHNDFIPRNMD